MDRYDTELVKITDLEFFDVIIQIQSKGVTHIRTYQTIESMLAEIGGFTNIILIIIGCLVRPVLRRLFVVELSIELDRRQKYLSTFQKEDLLALEKFSDLSYFNAEAALSIN